jgi:hypothetical protein
MTLPIPVSDLLALRDGEPLAPERAVEIEEDDRARSDLRRLRRIKHALQTLPDIEPDAELWGRIQQRSSARSGGRGRIVRRLFSGSRGASDGWRGGAGESGLRYPLATAALVFCATALAILLWFPRGEELDLDTRGALVSRSQQLESAVRFDGPAQGTYRVSSSEQALLYRISDVDTELESLLSGEVTDHARERELWQLRVELLENLLAIRRSQSSLARPAIY